MSTFTFTSREATARDFAARTGAFHATSGTMTGEVIRTLESGRDVVGTMLGFATGSRFPETATIAFHEECPTEGPLRRQCQARAASPRNLIHLASPSRIAVHETVDPFDAPVVAGALYYAASARKALAAADVIGAIAIVHPADMRTGEQALREGATVVATLDSMNGDFRIPMGAAFLLDPEIPASMARGRAEARALVCGAVEPSLDDRSRFLAALSRPLPNLGAIASLAAIARSSAAAIIPESIPEPAPASPGYDPSDFM